MKLNFWQWLGVVLLVVGLWLWISREMRDREAAEAGKPVPGFEQITAEEPDEPTTEPTTVPTPAAPAE